MTTVLDIVTSALRNLNLIELSAEPDAVEGQWALDQLNDMAAAWEAQGIHTGWTDVALADEFPLDARHRLGVTYMLMELIATRPLTAAEAKHAERGYANLCADYKTVEKLRMDDGLLGMPSERGSWWPAAWQRWW